MTTLPHPEKRVKVVALLTRNRERVLIDEPLTLDTLALIQASSPLSRAFLGGAGMAIIPKAVAVYVDGKLVWCEDCPRCGRTDLTSVTRKGGHYDVHPVPFTDAFPADYEWDDERIAGNRAAWETLRNDYSDRDAADEWVADVLESAGSHRPKLRPTKPAPESAKQHAPFPCPTYGKSNVTLGLPYKPAGSWRLTHTENAGPGANDHVEFLPIP